MHVKEENDYREINDVLLNELKEEIVALKDSTSGVVTLFNEGQVGQKWLVRIGRLVLWLAAMYGAYELYVRNE